MAKITFKTVLKEGDMIIQDGGKTQLFVKQITGNVISLSQRGNINYSDIDFEDLVNGDYFLVENNFK